MLDGETDPVPNYKAIVQVLAKIEQIVFHLLLGGNGAAVIDVDGVFRHRIEEIHLQGIAEDS